MQTKRAFAYISGFDAAALPNIALRLRNVRFDLNCDMQVLGVDTERDSLDLEVSVRREHERLNFDGEHMTTRKDYEYKLRVFTLSHDSVSTPNGKRDIFSTLAEALKRAGVTFNMNECACDLAAWATEFLRSNDTAQFGGMQLKNFYAEPRLLGGFNAKTVDNRIALGTIQELAGKLHSLKFGWFDEGMKCSVDARADGVLTVGCKEEDALGGLLLDHTRRYLAHCHAVGQLSIEVQP